MTNNYTFIYQDSTGYWSVCTNPVFIAEHKMCKAIKKSDIESGINQYLKELNNKSKEPKKQLPDLKVGTAVVVWDGEGYPKKHRKFKKFTKKGKMVCFESGYAGMYNCVSKWEYWEIME